MKLSLSKVDSVVGTNPNFFWEGWNLFFFIPSANAFTRTDGIFRNGQWGVAKSIKTDKFGRYLIPSKYLQ